MIRFPRLFVLILCCLGACSHLLSLSDPLTVRSKTFTSASGKEVRAEVGEIKVPENRLNLDSQEIPLKFIRLKTEAKRPLTPVVYLAGGPGSPAAYNAENPNILEDWLPLLERADIIFVDQRGTGAAAQRLTYIDFAGPPSDFWTSEVAVNTHYQKMVTAAVSHWENTGVDVAGYTTIESATDIDQLREALALPKISLVGFSYGTHLGQAYMKAYGDFVDRAILIGAEGLNETLKEPLAMDEHFQMIASLAKEDPKVNDLVPDLVQLYREVAGQLLEAPVEVTVTDPLSGNAMQVNAGKYALDFILFMDLGDASDLPVIPRLLYEMSQGDYRAFSWFLNKRITNGYGINAMSTNMDYSSGATAERLELVRQQCDKSMFGGVTTTPFLDLGQVWPYPQLDDNFRAPLQSKIPTLILSGTLDRNTPVAQGQRLADQLANATHLIVEHAGHEQIIAAQGAVKTMTDFLAGDKVEDIHLSYKPLVFLPLTGPTGQDVHPAVRGRE